MYCVTVNRKPEQQHTIGHSRYGNDTVKEMRRERKSPGSLIKSCSFMRCWVTRNLTNCVKCWLWRILFGGPLHEFGTFVSVCPSGVHEDAHLSVSPPQHPYLLYQRCRPCSLFKRRFFWDTGDATADLCSKNHSFAIHVCLTFPSMSSKWGPTRQTKPLLIKAYQTGAEKKVSFDER